MCYERKKKVPFWGTVAEDSRATIISLQRERSKYRVDSMSVGQTVEWADEK